MGRVVRRRLVAAVAALVLVAEAVGIVLINTFLGMVVDKQEMSLAGLEPRAMTVSTWIAGGLFGVYLLLCALILLRSAVRDAPPLGFFRIVLISAAVVHGLLGAATAGIVGWLSFVFMMVVLALIVWSLVWYGEAPARRDAAAGGADGGPQPEPSV